MGSQTLAGQIHRRSGLKRGGEGRKYEERREGILWTLCKINK